MERMSGLGRDPGTDRVNAALLPIDSALATVLRERSDWKLVYHDRVALLFEKTENAK